MQTAAGAMEIGGGSVGSCWQLANIINTAVAAPSRNSRLRRTIESGGSGDGNQHNCMSCHITWPRLDLERIDPKTNGRQIDVAGNNYKASSAKCLAWPAVTRGRRESNVMFIS